MAWAPYGTIQMLAFEAEESPGGRVGAGGAREARAVVTAGKPQQLPRLVTSATFEIEAPLVPDASPANHQDEDELPPSGLFPMNLCVFCHPSLILWLPTQLFKIQGWTHLMLVCGVIACMVLLTDGIVSFYHSVRYALGGHVKDKAKLSSELMQNTLAFIFITPTVFYLFRTLGQYDESLRHKRKQAEAERQKLIAAYLQTLGDMDRLLKTTTETSAGFAERNFEMKRRDFQRFLERTLRDRGSLDASDMVSGTNFKVGEADLYFEMKRFVQNWLRVFAECSVDPINAPRQVVSDEELNRCATVSELCHLCAERLTSAEVKFYTRQQVEDAQTIGFFRRKLDEISRRGSVVNERSQTMLEPRVRGQGESVCKAVCRKVSRYIANMSWMACGQGKGKIQPEEPDETGYPRILRFACFCTVVLLSREHVGLLVSFGCGWVLLALEILSEWMQKKIITSIVILEICLVVTLIRFESIDIIQRLVKEARTIAREKESVRQMHDKMVSFWHDCQINTDIWLHRTVPRLDLYAEVHGCFEDLPNHQLLPAVAGMNAKLEALDCELGALEAWQAGGLLSDSAKKKFGQNVGSVCQCRGLEEISQRLDRLSAGALLDQAPPTHDNDLSPSRGFSGSSRRGRTGS